MLVFRVQERTIKTIEKNQDSSCEQLSLTHDGLMLCKIFMLTFSSVSSIMERMHALISFVMLLCLNMLAKPAPTSVFYYPLLWNTGTALLTLSGHQAKIKAAILNGVKPECFTVLLIFGGDGKQLTSHGLLVIETHMAYICCLGRVLSVWSVMCKQAHADPR